MLAPSVRNLVITVREGEDLSAFQSTKTPLKCAVTHGLVFALFFFPLQAAVAAPQVELIDAGRGPKQLLTYTVQEGAEEEVECKLTMRMTMAQQGREFPEMPSPTMVFRFKNRITKVTAEGDIHLQGEVTSGRAEGAEGVSETLLTKLDQVMKSFLGSKINSIHDSRGALRTASVEMSSQQNTEQLEQAVNNLQQQQTVFPSAPVGVGAIWESTREIEQNGIRLRQIQRHTLLERNGSRLRIKFTMEQRADPQALNHPNLPAGASAKLINLTSNGTGEILTDIKRIAPISSTLEMESESAFQFIMKGREPMTMKMKTALTGLITAL